VTASSDSQARMGCLQHRVARRTKVLTPVADTRSERRRPRNLDGHGHQIWTGASSRVCPLRDRPIARRVSSASGLNTASGGWS
jgi:hypothetical protein